MPRPTIEHHRLSWGYQHAFLVRQLDRARRWPERRTVAAGLNHRRPRILCDFVQIIAAVNLRGETAVRRAVRCDGPRPIAMPILLWGARFGDACCRAVQLDTRAENRLHALHHRRIVQQKGEPIVLFKQLADELAVIAAGVTFVKCGA